MRVRTFLYARHRATAPESKVARRAQLCASHWVQGSPLPPAAQAIISDRDSLDAVRLSRRRAGRRNLKTRSRKIACREPAVEDESQHQQ